MANSQYLTVKALTKYIKRKFDVDPHLSNVFVKGEISNFKQHTSGHLYFTLKDESTRITAVMFARAASSMKFIPENGMHVLIRGNVTVYEVSGQYQIYVQEMHPDGIGELFLAYEQLKEKLEKEGLFLPERKRALPPYPETIGVITSPTGAAIRDIITTLKRRYPLGAIKVIPALVQGERAAHSIVEAIERANKRTIADVLIVGRGGGSIEELWAFNEEIVARAIAQSSIPIISAVGHETDYTIADFVADMRAATPTAAAELAVPHVEDLMEHLMQRKTRLYQSMGAIVQTSRNKLNYLEQSYIFRNPQKIYEQKWQTVDQMVERLHSYQKYLFMQKKTKFSNLQKRLQQIDPKNYFKQNKENYLMAKHRLKRSAASIYRSKASEFTGKVATLKALSPLNILQRGFNVAYTESGELLKSVAQGHAGEKLQLQLQDGKLFCTINDKEKGAENEG